MSHKRRMRPNGSQSQQLKEFFNVNPHPSKEERQELGNTIGMYVLHAPLCTQQIYDHLLCQDLPKVYQSAVLDFRPSSDFLHFSITNWFQNQRSLIKRRKEEDVLSTASSRSRTFSAFPPASGHPSLLLLASGQSNLTPPVSEKPRSTRVHRTTAKATRSRRSRPEPHQLDALKDLYSRTSNPTIEERTALAHEVGLDLGKVTNWFRNLRQTTRKRAKRNSELGDDDQDDASIYSGYPPSTSVSRDGSPMHSSAASTINDVLMDDIGDEMSADVGYRSRKLTSSDPQSRDHSDDEEFRWEAVTPSPSPPPSNTNSSKHPLTITIDPILYAEMEKETAKYNTGVRVEDALLLLGFQHHAFVHHPAWWVVFDYLCTYIVDFVNALQLRPNENIV
jgi:Homeodomain